ncbi:MAG: hypothetical protein WBD41_11970 [Rhodococcus sp. (in: high G+C Gram-positive bacteria)]
MDTSRGPARIALHLTPWTTPAASGRVIAHTRNTNLQRPGLRGDNDGLLRGFADLGHLRTAVLFREHLRGTI